MLRCFFLEGGVGGQGHVLGHLWGFGGTFLRRLIGYFVKEKSVYSKQQIRITQQRMNSINHTVLFGAWL